MLLYFICCYYLENIKYLDCKYVYRREVEFYKWYVFYGMVGKILKLILELFRVIENSDIIVFYEKVVKNKWERKF